MHNTDYCYSILNSLIRRRYLIREVSDKGARKALIWLCSGRLLCYWAGIFILPTFLFRMLLPLILFPSYWRSFNYKLLLLVLLGPFFLRLSEAAAYEAYSFLFRSSAS